MNPTNNTTVIETIEFRATAPNTRLSGLENAQRRLDALSASLKAVQAQLAGISSGTIFKLSARQFADRAYTQEGKLGSLSVRQLARRLGFPDTKDVAAMAAQLENELQVQMAKVQRRIDDGLGKRATENARRRIRELQGQSYFTDASARVFKNPTQAGRFFEQYAKAALTNKERGEAALRAILQGVEARPANFGSPANLGQAVAQAIENAKAESGKRESGNSRKTSATASRETAPSPLPSPPRERGSSGVTTTRTFPDGKGGLIEERVTSYPGTDRPDKLTRVQRTGNGQTLTTTIQGDVEQRTLRTKTEERLAKGFDQRLNALVNEYGRSLRTATGAGNPLAYRSAVMQGGALFRSNPQFAQLGFRDRMAEFVEQLRARQAAYQKWQLGQEARSDSLRRATNFGRSEIEERAALAMGDVAVNQQVEREQQALKKKANRELERQLKRMEREAGEDQLAEIEKRKRLKQRQDVDAHEAALRARGARLLKEQTDPVTGRILSRRFGFESGGSTYVSRLDYEAGGGATARLTRGASLRAPKTRLQSAIEGLSPENMLANVVKVSSWAAAVMVLYKSVELANYSLKRLEQTGMEMAHLGVVFRNAGGTVQELTNDMISLAAVQGRETSETMESATAWARLGGDRRSINEEVRVSAVAANIANMHMAETTKQLMSLMHIYHLEAGDLNGTLGMLVNTSLKYNVTLEELFTGLDRSAAAAKVAGVKLAELQGMIGVVVGTTGSSGSMTGNSLKYIFQELNKSEVQQQLREKFKVEALGNNLEQKPAGQILGELSGVWGTLGSRQQQALGGLLGGRFNAARVPVVLEEYPQILKLAIDAQLGLNSAQEANSKILDTLKAQLAGIRAEWDKLIINRAGNQWAYGAMVLKNTLGLLGGSGDPEADQRRRNEILDRLDRQRNPLRRFLGGAYLGLNTARHVLSLGFGANDSPGLVEALHRHSAAGLVEQAQDAVGARLEGFRKSAGANALRTQGFGIAMDMLRNGSMTQGSANVFAEMMKGQAGGQANATAFLNAFGGGNRDAAMSVLSRANEQALKERQAALEGQSAAIKKNNQDMTEQYNTTQAVITQKIKLGQEHKEEDAKIQAINQALEQNNQNLNNNASAYEELEGQIDAVQISQQKYLNLLKTQEDLIGDIGRGFEMVQAHTPAAALQNQIQSLEMQLAANKKAQDEFEASGELHGPHAIEADQVRAQFIEREKKLQAELASAQARQGEAGLLTAEQRGIFNAENVQRGAGYGYTEADKLLRERAALTKDIQGTEEQMQSSERGSVEWYELQGRQLKEQELLFQNQLDLRRRAVDVEKEIHQLAIDQNREFARSFFGSGPAEMLRKLAAFRIASSGGVSPGQFFNMGSTLRQDVGQLTGFNPEMARLLLERNQPNLGLALRGFASGGYTGDGDPNEVAGVVHKGEYVIPHRDLWKNDIWKSAFDMPHPLAERSAFNAGKYGARGATRPTIYEEPMAPTKDPFYNRSPIHYLKRSPIHYLHHTGFDRSTYDREVAAYLGVSRPDGARGATRPTAIPLPAVSGQRAVPEAGAPQNDAVKNASAAMDLLAGAAGKLQAAFESLSSRVATLFTGGGGVKFAGSGQTGGGWYPGKQM